MISILLAIANYIDSLSQWLFEVGTKFKSFLLRKLRHREIKCLRDETPTHTGSHGSTMTRVQICLTPTPSYFESNWYMWFRRQHRNNYMPTIHFISVCGQISLQYKVVCYILYKFVCVNMYIERDLTFSLSYDKTWRIIVSMTHELHIFFHFADPGMFIYPSSAWELQCAHN